MNSTSLLLKYFPLTEKQQTLFEQLGELYHEWNAKINLISRKDMEHLYLHHILHSLSIAKLINFKDGTRIIDVGTGGGLPGLPLAIMFPKCSFLLVDSIGKKIMVVQDMIDRLKLENAFAENTRAENLDEQVDFVTGRAISSLTDFYTGVKHLVYKGGNNKLYNGILYLGGGDLEAGLGKLKSKSTLYPISKWFDEDYFERKMIVHIKV